MDGGKGKGKAINDMEVDQDDDNDILKLGTQRVTSMEDAVALLTLCHVSFPYFQKFEDGGALKYALEFMTTNNFVVCDEDLAIYNNEIRGKIALTETLISRQFLFRTLVANDEVVEEFFYPDEDLEQGLESLPKFLPLALTFFTSSVLLVKSIVVTKETFKLSNGNVLTTSEIETRIARYQRKIEQNQGGEVIRDKKEFSLFFDKIFS